MEKMNKMKWNLKFKTPDMVQEAAATGGKNVVVEMLMFLGVYLVSQIAIMLVVLPFEMVALFGNEAYVKAAASGDIATAMEVGMGLANSNYMLMTTLLATSGIILVSLLFCKLVQKRKMRTVGFKKKNLVKEYLIGLVVGFVMMLVAVLVNVMTGAVKLNGISADFSMLTVGWLVLFFIGFMIQGMSEEVLCRGYMLVSVARRKKQVWLAVVVNSVFFAALHLLNSGISVLAFINLVLFGIFASIYFVKRGNIWGIAAVHSIWNFTQGNVFGILVSGGDYGPKLLESSVNENMTLINGGAFGLEGGIVVTVVLVLGIVVLGFLKQKDVVEVFAE